MKPNEQKEEIDYEERIEKEMTNKKELPKEPEKKKELKITYGGVYVWE